MRTWQVAGVASLSDLERWAQVLDFPERQLVVIMSITGPAAPNLGSQVVAEWQLAKLQTEFDLYQTCLQVQEIVAKGGAELGLAAMMSVADDKIAVVALNGQWQVLRDGEVKVICQAGGSWHMKLGQPLHGDRWLGEVGLDEVVSRSLVEQLKQGFTPESVVARQTPEMHQVAQSAVLVMVTMVPGMTDTTTISPVTNGLLRDLDEAVLPLEASKYHVGAAVSSAAVVATQPIGIDEAPPVSPRRRVVGLTKIFQQVGMVFGRLPRLVAVIANRLRRLPRRFWLALFGLLLVAGVALAGGSIWWQQRQERQRVAAATMLQPFSDRLAQVQTQFDSQPVRSRETLAQMLSELDQLLATLSPGSLTYQILAEERQRWLILAEEISGQDQVNDLTTFYDLQLVAPDVAATAMDISGTTVAFLDADRHRVVTLDTTSKQFQTFSLPDTETQQDILIQDNTLWVLGNPLRSFSLSQPDNQEVRSTAEVLNQARLIGRYNQSIYVLNPSQRTIARLAPGEGAQLADPSAWIRAGQAVPLAEVMSLSIDGDIWLGTQDGRVIKMSAGRLEPFTVVGLEPALSGSLLVFTTAELSELYILEPGQSRLVILAKTGEFLRQISSHTLAAATDLVVTPTAQQALILSGSLVFSIDLNAP